MANLLLAQVQAHIPRLGRYDLEPGVWQQVSIPSRLGSWVPASRFYEDTFTDINRPLEEHVAESGQTYATGGALIRGNAVVASVGGCAGVHIKKSTGENYSVGELPAAGVLTVDVHVGASPAGELGIKWNDYIAWFRPAQIYLSRGFDAVTTITVSPPFVDGDVVTWEVAGVQVTFRRNGVLLYSSPLDPVASLIGFYSFGGSDDLGFHSLSLGEIAPPGLQRGTPSVRAKVANYVIAQLESKYGAGCVTVANAYPGDLNRFLSYVPGSTPTTSEHNFELMREETDGTFEPTAFWIKSNHPSAMVLDFTEWR